MVSFPATSSKARELTGGIAALNNQLVNMLKCAINHEYFEYKFGEDFALAVSVFKCAQIVDPAKVAELKPTGSVGSL